MQQFQNEKMKSLIGKIELASLNVKDWDDVSDNLCKLSAKKDKIALIDFVLEAREMLRSNRYAERMNSPKVETVSFKAKRSGSIQIHQGPGPISSTNPIQFQQKLLTIPLRSKDNSRITTAQPSDKIPSPLNTRVQKLSKSVFFLSLIHI
eukprot:TRINITY_DN12842_c0_g1_i1.p1 TRINITY_DN12842_c0_g1~~TRINITY_DN12842_c0_g1_i1.p1  ORF type:complete len:150 (+),score=22.41 TRINITY_DN12842_c0_g1_i1:79-528(+)